jgi:hypothetical protein
MAVVGIITTGGVKSTPPLLLWWRVHICSSDELCLVHLHYFHGRALTVDQYLLSLPCSPVSNAAIIDASSRVEPSYFRWWIGAGGANGMLAEGNRCGEGTERRGSMGRHRMHAGVLQSL